MIDSRLSYSGRQFLVTDYQADILKSLLAVALALAGPRLWTLLRASLVWITARQFLKPSSKSNQNGTESLELRNFINEHLDLTHESHTELSAAHHVLQHVWQELRTGRIHLPANQFSPGGQRRSTRAQRSYESLKNAAKKILNVSASILLSCLLFGIFVVLSRYI